MSELPASAMTGDQEGKLVSNLIYFCKTLRRAGIPVATSQIHQLITAVQLVGFERKDDFRDTLRACLITKHEHRALFDQAFMMFWRDPEFLQKMMQSLMPMLDNKDAPKKPKAAERRASEAILDQIGKQRDQSLPDKDEITLDARLSLSDKEHLSQMDFEQMSLDELEQAKQAILTLDFQLPKIVSRRFQKVGSGHVLDARASFHQARRQGGEILKLITKSRRPRPRNLVVLCDISGSMSTYSTMLMHFIYGLTHFQSRAQKWSQIHAFTFGTQLTNISRDLRQSDPDLVLTAISQKVKDWNGGTHIGRNLEMFNQFWLRRVLGSDALVLLVTDGLERGDIALLEAQMQRLKRSSGHLIWLNPLLRYDQFEPSARGIRIMLDQVDRMVPCHNVASLADLAHHLSKKPN